MKTILFLFPLFCLSFILAAQQVQKPVVAAKPAQTVQKAPAPAPEPKVDIKYDEQRQFFYLADSVTGNLLKVFPYKKVNPFKEGLALFETDKSIGYINSKGVEVVPANGKYTWGSDFNEGMAQVALISWNSDGTENKRTVGFINKKGALVIPLKFQEASNFKENLAAVKMNGKWGYINKTGTIVIPCKFQEAYTFSLGLAVAAVEKTTEFGPITKYGYIDKTGKTILPFDYSYASGFKKSFPEEYALVQKDFDYFLINKKGEEVFDLTYHIMVDKYVAPVYLGNGVSSEGHYEKENVAYKPSSAKWVDDDDLILSYRIERGTTLTGVYSCGRGDFQFKPEYPAIESAVDPVTGRTLYYFQSKYGSKKGIGFDSHDNIPALFDIIQFNDSLIYAISDVKVENEQVVGGKFSLYDLHFKAIVDYKERYDQITGFFDGLAMVKSNGKTGFINKKGEKVIPLEYDNAGIFVSGMAAVVKGTKVGAINTKGEMVIPCEYDELGIFVDGVTYYKQNGLKGIIDASGKKITEPVYEEMTNFSSGMAAIIKDKKIGFVNTKGETVIPATFEGGNGFSDGLAMIKLNGKVGYIDPQGKQVIPYRYDNAADFMNGHAIVQENDKYYLIEKQGNIVKSYN